MKPVFALLLCCAACEFNLPGPNDVFLCPGGTGGCDQNGNPLPTGTGTASTGATGVASGTTSAGTTGGTSSGASTGASSGTTGGTSSGTGGSSGATVCPARDGGTVYVSVEGSDVRGTGVPSPTSCAYRTLTEALSIAQAPSSGISVVEVIGGTSSKPMLFDSDGGERFPLVIPSSVSLTTDLELQGHAVASQAAYTIALDSTPVGDAGPLSIVNAETQSVGGGGALAGFTLTDDTGLADGVQCSGPFSAADCTFDQIDQQVLGGPALAGIGFSAVSGCAASLANVTINGFNSQGMEISGGSFVAIDGGTLSNNGLASTGNCHGDGIYVANGTLDMQNVAVNANNLHGLSASKGTITGTNVFFDGGGFCNVGIAIGESGSGNCNEVSTARVTLTNIVVDSNLGDGVHVYGGTGGKLDLLGSVRITNNGGDGLNLAAGSVYLDNPTVSGNGSLGLYSPYDAGGSLAVDGGTIGPDNRELGTVSEVSIKGNATFRLHGTTVQDNPKSDGVFLGGNGSYVLSGCDIHGNSGNGLALAGGTLGEFTGNRIHGNGKNQVNVTGAQDGGAPWDLSSADCDGGQNAFYCYAVSDAGPYVGIEVSDGGSVVANDDSWENASPHASSDYVGDVVVSGGACAAITTCDGG
ncbi:MAG TPA: right-handed parallel beta-helix repeat-containing protein [Myxococcales bacterium]|nr:right-handed parallel beta-helix repeat-containing protein [Myxococcales bacterium]